MWHYNNNLYEKLSELRKVNRLSSTKMRFLLKTNQIIDQRLFDWGDALRKERNIGAHASDEEVTKDDARDIIDFTIAIFDYVYRLSTKYEDYMARKNKNI